MHKAITGAACSVWFLRKEAVMLGRIVVLGVLLLVTVLSNVSSVSAVDSAVSVYEFDTAEKVLVLTFDAGADRGYAPQILDTLRDEGVKATFGMTGHWAEQHPDLIRRMVNEGHHLMNHTWTHRSFTGRSTGQPALTAAERRDEIVRTENIIREQTGVDLKPYFRPPYGDIDASVLRDIAANGYTVNVMWTVDSLGWRGLSENEIIKRVVDGATPGGDILMHVGGQSLDGPALPDMIQQLRDKGYRFATVDELYTGRVGPAQRFFPETGFEVKGNFMTYWNRFGGLPVFGYPITGERQEQGATVQYFERARFELRPGSWPERNDILLGLLGVEFTEGRSNQQPFQRVQASTSSNCTYYLETGHSLCFAFRDYWRTHGALPILGFPISEEFRENGVTVQYFERARFEWRPENAPPWDVLLAHFGRWKLEQ
jgi:peptidoglycan/xylan/chitin deacetylase (PgdA/CDA1 family)